MLKLSDKIVSSQPYAAADLDIPTQVLFVGSILYLVNSVTINAIIPKITAKMATTQDQFSEKSETNIDINST